MKYYQWEYSSKYKIYGNIIAFMAFPIIIIIASLFFAQNNLSVSIVFLLLGLILIFVIYITYRYDWRYLINTKIILIPIFKNKSFILPEKIDDVNFFYQRIIKKIEFEMKQNRIDYQKKIEKKVGFIFPWIILLNIEQKNIPIWIIRHKYFITINVGNLLPDNEIYFDQMLKNTIEFGIGIENPFYKEKE